MSWIHVFADAAVVERIGWTLLLLFCVFPAKEALTAHQPVNESSNTAYRELNENMTTDQFVATPVAQESAPAKQIDPETQKRIAGLIEDLKDYQLGCGASNDWMIAIRELTKIGDDAVVPLVEALDKTTDDKSLRSIGFTLRAIGDPRAVPALIRALPRTLRKPGSDMGLTCDDPDLLEFMQKHDKDADNRDDRFGLGRPVNEITSALKKITETDQGDGELVHIFLDGSEIQRWQQRKQYHDLAVRWTEWWKDNWSITMDPKYKDVNLPAFDLPRPEKVELANPFPVGELARFEGGSFGGTVEPIQDAERTCLVDLDTGRQTANLKPYFPEGTRDYAEYLNEHRDEFLAAVAKDGFDILGIRTKVPGVEKAQNVIVPLGMRVWRIDNGRFEALGKELAAGEPLKLGEPETRFLMAFDTESKKYLPEKQACFLYETREGATGAIQIVEQISRKITWQEWVELGRGELPKGSGPQLGVKINRRNIFNEEEKIPRLERLPVF